MRALTRHLGRLTGGRRIGGRPPGPAWLRITAAFGCLLGLSTCFIEGDAAYQGDYAFRPQTAVVDTNIYPLRHLLIIEDNFAVPPDPGGDQGPAANQSLVYYFEGDIGAADLGFSDLRRLVQNFNDFDMDFNTPRTRYASEVAKLADGPDDDGPDDGDRDDGDDLPGPRTRRLLRGDREVAVLYRMDNEVLVGTGTTRFLRSVTNSDYMVRAYAGTFTGALPTDALRVAGTGVQFTPAVNPGEPVLAPDDDGETISLQTAELAGADYLIVELMQTITPLDDVMDTGDDDAGVDEGGMFDAGPDAGFDAGPDAGFDPGLDAALDGAADGGVYAGADGGLEDDPAVEDRSREALMRTEMLPETRYTLGASLVSGAFGLGCWTLDGPLSLRLIQIDRQYHADGAGDFAIVHHRFDAQVVPTDVWHPLVQDPEPAGYCDDYLP